MAQSERCLGRPGKLHGTVQGLAANNLGPHNGGYDWKIGGWGRFGWHAENLCAKNAMFAWPWVRGYGHYLGVLLTRVGWVSPTSLPGRSPCSGSLVWARCCCSRSASQKVAGCPDPRRYSAKRSITSKGHQRFWMRGLNSTQDDPIHCTRVWSGGISLDVVGPLPGRQGWDIQRAESARPGREPPGLDPSLGRFNGKQVKTNPYETIVFTIYTIASAIDRGGF